MRERYSRATRSLNMPGLYEKSTMILTALLIAVAVGFAAMIWSLQRRLIDFPTLLNR